MVKKAVLFIMLLISIRMYAQTDGADRYPRITYGAEWGYVAMSTVTIHENFFSPDGYRFNRKYTKPGPWNNGELYLHMGYNLNENTNISLYTGMYGIGDVHNAIPLSLRLTRYFGNNSLDDRFFTFIDAGTGISIKREPQKVLSAKIGGGYRISLSRDTKIDFIGGIRYIHTHNQIMFDHQMIELEWTNRNDAKAYGISIGMALTF